MSQIVTNRSKQILLAVLMLLTMARTSLAPPDKNTVEHYLRADTTTKTMPDGQVIVMWGFALDSAFGAEDGEVTVPGPVLTVPNDKKNLVINLDNNLGVPVSIVIPSQINTTVVPVKFTDDKGRQRIRSFTHETEPNNTEPVIYEWKNFRPGTYLYHSGSHPAVQVQMGLYGCLKKDVEKVKGKNVPDVAYKQGNTLVTYDTDVVLCFSEIDPALHNAVATGNYGLGKAMTSTINYQPKYFLINGEPYSSGSPPLPAGNTDDRVLLRFVNAGIETHVPVLQGLYMTVVAEDGYPYKYTKEQYSLILPALKTKDVVIIPQSAGTYPVYDRRLRLTNADISPGGMLTYLAVEPAGNVGLASLASFNATSTGKVMEKTTRSFTIKKLKVKTGKKAGMDKISAVGKIDFTAAGIAATNNVLVNIRPADDSNEPVYSESISFNRSKGKKGKYLYKHRVRKGKPGAISLLLLDLKKHKFSMQARNINLTGLSYPVSLEVEIGDSTWVANWP